MQKCGVDNIGRLENGQAIPTQVLDKYLGTLYMPAQWTASPYAHGQVHSVFLRAQVHMQAQKSLVRALPFVKQEVIWIVAT